MRGATAVLRLLYLGGADVLQLVSVPAGTSRPGTVRPSTGKDRALRSSRVSALPDAAMQSSLAERVGRGDTAAEETVVALFHERVRLMALSRTRVPEVAEEVAQDVLVAVITALRNGQLREGERLTAFVYGAARNYVNDYFRISARRPQPCPLEPEHAVVEGDPLEASERQAVVRSALKTLKPADRQILLLTL